MSADNWAVCPRCKLNEMNAIKALDYRVEKEYGKLSIDDFLVLRNEAQNRREGLPQQKATYREDYEIYGAEEGMIEVSYSGSCKCCGLITKFTYSHGMDI